MQDDITLIFSRVNDRIDNIVTRLTRINNLNVKINADLASIRKETSDIKSDADKLDAEISNQP
jgi:septation ring formation regulator EzrA